jgi:uncharacterized protein YuzE
LSNNIHLDGEKSDVAYLRLPDHPGAGKAAVVSKSLKLREFLRKNEHMEFLELLGEIEVIFDIDENEHVVGIEILT